jgi:RNA polymerase-binding transcription factor DksA
MAKIVRPVFGKPCKDCGEQIPMARIRALEAMSVLRVFRCTSCASLSEARHRNAMAGARDDDVVVIRRR